MQSVHTRILMGYNRYHNAELLIYAVRNVSRNLLRFLRFLFFSLILMERVLAWPTVTTQTAAFSAAMWANNNLL